MQQVSIATPHGDARVEIRRAADQRAILLLGHGAGGGTGAPDLQRATKVANEHGVTVGLVEQPYRVAGRRSPAPAKQLDASWLAVVEHLRGHALGDLPLLVGGRSSGARVACRTAGEAGAAGVLCLAFPLHPPGKPEKTRLAELEQVDAPVLIVQGRSDAFGMPPEAKGREVVVVDGDHALRKEGPRISEAIAGWLTALLGERR